MPVIASFYGIIIRMYFREHGVPHFHAIYGEFGAVIDLATLEIIEGSLPKRGERMVKEWAEVHRGDLLDMWTSQRMRRLPGLE